MKKYLPTLFLTTLIMPSIAFASWWNPLSWFNSWSFAGGTSAKTEVLEKRITELENRLKTSATSTLATSTQEAVTATTTTPRKLVKTTTKPVVSTTSTAPKNYNSDRVIILDTAITAINKRVSLAESMMADLITLYIEPLSDRISFVTGINSTSDNALNVLIRSDKDTIKYYADTYNEINSNVIQLKNLIGGIEQRKLTILNGFYPDKDLTNEEISYYTDQLKSGGIYGDKIYSLYQAVSSYDKTYNQEYRNAVTMLKSQASQYAQSVSNYQPPTHTYQPMAIPQIQMPKTTYCTMGGGIGGNYSIICN